MILRFDQHGSLITLCTKLYAQERDDEDARENVLNIPIHLEGDRARMLALPAGTSCRDLDGGM